MSTPSMQQLTDTVRADLLQWLCDSFEIQDPRRIQKIVFTLAQDQPVTLEVTRIPDCTPMVNPLRTVVGEYTLVPRNMWLASMLDPVCEPCRRHRRTMTVGSL